MIGAEQPLAVGQQTGGMGASRRSGPALGQRAAGHLSERGLLGGDGDLARGIVHGRLEGARRARAVALDGCTDRPVDIPAVLG